MQRVCSVSKRVSVVVVKYLLPLLLLIILNPTTNEYK
nr:MAG TPA: hypothetical protein [Crassvirales sp.]